MEENKNKGGMIVLLIFLLICSGFGIAAFTMSLTKCGSSIPTELACSDCTKGSGDCIYSGNDKAYDGHCYSSKGGVCPGGYVKCL